MKKLVAADSSTPTHENGPLLAAVEERIALVFSELATNALRYGRPPVIAVLSRQDEGWLIVVTDCEPDLMPVPRTSTPDQEGGRGLRLVEAMSELNGWYAEGGSKHVWAELGDAAPPALIDTLQRR